jgi:hypothetical protein
MAVFGGCTGNGLAVPFETTIRLAAPPPPQPTGVCPVMVKNAAGR